MNHMPNVEIGIMSEIQPDDERATKDTNPLPYTYLFYTHKLLDVLNLSFGRTEQCKHRGSCVCAAIASSTKASLFSYLIKAGVSSLFGLKKFITKPKKLFEPFIGKDSIKFGFFVCTFLLILRTLVCLLRRKLGSDQQKIGFMIGGLIGGTLAALLLDKKSRQTFGLFLMARAIDITYRSLVQKKIVPDFKYFYPCLYALMMIVTGGIAFGSEPASMSPDLYPFYLLFTSETAQDQQMRQIWIGRKNNALLKKGVATYNSLDYLPKARAIYNSRK